MEFKKPKNTDKITWTKHSIRKMRFYGLSENRLKKVLRNPKRKEDGVAPETLAVMQRTGSKKHPTEIWLMYQPTAGHPKANQPYTYKPQRLKIISAWRYPGISPKGKEIPIPDDILEELNETILNPHLNLMRV